MEWHKEKWLDIGNDSMIGEICHMSLLSLRCHNMEKKSTFVIFTVRSSYDKLWQKSSHIYEWIWIWIFMHSKNNNKHLENKSWILISCWSQIIFLIQMFFFTNLPFPAKNVFKLHFILIQLPSFRTSLLLPFKFKNVIENGVKPCFPVLYVGTVPWFVFVKSAVVASAWAEPSLKLWEVTFFLGFFSLFHSLKKSGLT